MRSVDAVPQRVRHAFSKMGKGRPLYFSPKCTAIIPLYTHTHPFNGPLSGTTRVRQYQEGKANLDFTGARDSEWQWHQLRHMQVCTSLQTDNHTSTSPCSFLQAGCPSCRPTNSVKALKATSLFKERIFSTFHMLCRLAKTSRRMKAQSIFGEIWGNFPISPKIGGRGDESKHGILKLHHTPNTHTFNGPLSRTTRVSWYQKGRNNLDFTEAKDSEWQWHQLGHMQVCTSLQTGNHASTPPLSFLQAGCPSCHPTNSVKALKNSSENTHELSICRF